MYICSCMVLFLQANIQIYFDQNTHFIKNFCSEICEWHFGVVLTFPSSQLQDFTLLELFFCTVHIYWTLIINAAI